MAGKCKKEEDLPHYISENYHTSVNDEVPSEAVTENGLYDAGLSLGKTSAEEIVTGNDEIMPWEYYEREIIRKALKKYGSYNAAGKALGLTHKTVAAKSEKISHRRIALGKNSQPIVIIPNKTSH